MHLRNQDLRRDGGSTPVHSENVPSTKVSEKGHNEISKGIRILDKQCLKPIPCDEDSRRYIMGWRGGSRRPSSRGAQNAPSEMPDEMEKGVGVE